MTTRFSIADLADMLHESVDVVRNAIEDLSARGELTAESFLYMERNWRVAPSDVKRVQAWIEDAKTSGRLTHAKSMRVIKRRQVIRHADETTDEQQV